MKRGEYHDIWLARRTQEAEMEVYELRMALDAILEFLELKLIDIPHQPRRKKAVRKEA